MQVSFDHSNAIQPSGCHSVIWLSFLHSSVIPPTIFHGDKIQSFGHHFTHFIVIWAQEWHEMTFGWDDRSDVRLTIWVGWGSFRHPRFLAKMWHFLISSLSSDVIPSFCRHPKIPFQREWPRNDGKFSAEFDYFPLSVASSGSFTLIAHSGDFASWV